MSAATPMAVDQGDYVVPAQLGEAWQAGDEARVEILPNLRAYLYRLSGVWYWAETGDPVDTGGFIPATPPATEPPA